MVAWLTAYYKTCSGVPQFQTRRSNAVFSWLLTGVGPGKAPASRHSEGPAGNEKTQEPRKTLCRRARVADIIAGAIPPDAPTDHAR
jgi:hypothetical protein